MSPIRTRMLILGVAFAIGLAAFAPAPAVRAVPRSFTLIGDSLGGWGSTVGTIANPGPPLSVGQGDSVTLTLNGTDAMPHTWFIDYNNNNVPDSGEPLSPQFQGNTPIMYTFTADRAGTFTYRCSFHPTTMTGTITIQAAPAPAMDLTLLYVGLGIVAVIVIAAVALMMRRKPKPPPQPPTQP